MAGRTLAIGDIHGCDVALETLLNKVQPTADDTVVVLGDVVDRGPDTKRVIELAQELGLWVVLGSNHKLSGTHKPHNCLYIIHPKQGIVDRYDKLFCMGSSSTADLAHYTPGSRFVTLEINSIRCGFLICHDWRYPEVYREYQRQGASLIFQSWYDGNIPDREMASPEGDANITVLPATMMGHAVCNHLWISATNTSKRNSVMGGILIQPNGVVAKKGPRNRTHVLFTTVDTSIPTIDLAAPWRRQAASGVLHSGQCVSDPRSDDRTCF